ncbi:MAG: YcgN family cysteine cluster protein [Proteobacteria bacterium]|nr:YcgN family cysteine cluster protein [Pseudomonadota bacterium]
MSAFEPKGKVAPPFWQVKSLDAMSDREWESLCDGCGRCCLNKLEEEDSGEIFFTDVACRLLDSHGCKCRDYANRSAVVEDCLRLTPQNIGELAWLPPTCGYRLVAQGRDLYWWHPLVSGDPTSVHAAGISVRGRVRASEDTVPDEALEDYIVDWPKEVPPSSLRKKA